MTELPGGTVTFLFTDIEGSTQLLQQLGAESYGKALSTQRVILRAAFDQFGGTEIDTQGDSFFASFSRATDAVRAVVQVQRALVDHDWPEGVDVRVRMGLHTGEPLVAKEGYIGMDVHRAARIAHVGHGGQVLLSEATAGLLKRDLPEDISLKDLGEYQLKDLRSSWKLFQLEIETLSAEFPELKAKLVKPPADFVEGEPLSLPAFLHDDAAKVGIDQPVFVARERELERLDRFLDKALSGQGQVAFISGGSGQGKTALMQNFASRAMDNQSTLLAAFGQCNPYTGVGNPHLPFRDVLAMLTGDVEGRWEAGSIATEHARRIWNAFPDVLQALIEVGTDLVDVFVPGRSLVARGKMAALETPWLPQMEKIVEEEHPALVDLDQGGLFNQVEQVLRSVAQKHPILLALDDLQWSDSASLNLLFHLGRRLSADRIMIVGAFRPEEVAIGRDGYRHPLEKLLAEFKRQYGDLLIELGDPETPAGREFVDEFLDTEPNHLSVDFRGALYHQTEGHPLFTIELLRDMQERGDLVLDNQGQWVESTVLDWSRLPARVEGVIEERIGRLEDELQDILTIASIEGEDFTAQVVARVREVRERGLIHKLNRELDRQHRLVAEQGQRQIGAQNLYLYRFRHSLFQRHLYNSCAQSERQLLHGEVGAVLEALYEDRTDEIAAQLAWHFDEAKEIEKAARYQLLAGDQARKQYALLEAIDHYEQAAGKFEAFEDWERAERAYTRLGITYHSVFEFEKSTVAYEKGRLIRARIPLGKIHPFEKPNQTLRIVYEEPYSLNPTQAGAVASAFFVRQLFRGLVTYNLEGDLLPDIAASWDILDDGLGYVFHLRDDVYWSDGIQVTAGDFEYAWFQLLHPDNQWGGGYRFAEPVKGGWAYKQSMHADRSRVGVRPIDDRTLEVELEDRMSHFIYMLGNPITFPVPSHIAQKRGSSRAEEIPLVTNGPFVLEDWQKGEKLTLIRNPAYKGVFAGNIGRIVFEFETDPEAQYRMYQEDEIDLLTMTQDVDMIVRAKQDYPEEYFMVPEPSTLMLYLDLESPPLKDLRVRKALALAIDKLTLAEVVVKGTSAPAMGGMIPIGMPGHLAGIGLRCDLNLAQETLAQAGYPEGKGLPELTLLAGGPHYREIAGFIADQWQQQLGLDIRIYVAKDWNEYIEFGGKESPQIRLGGWEAGTPDPSYFFSVVEPEFISGHNRIVKQARCEVDPERRLKLYQEADQMVIELVGVIPLLYARDHQLIKPRVQIPPWGISTKLENGVIRPH